MEFIAVPFTEDELNFIRAAYPKFATVEAIHDAALAESGRRINGISKAEATLRRLRPVSPTGGPPPIRPKKANGVWGVAPSADERNMAEEGGNDDWPRRTLKEADFAADAFRGKK